MVGEVLKSWGKRHLLKIKTEVDGEAKSRFAVISEAGLLGTPGNYDTMRDVMQCVRMPRFAPQLHMQQ